MEVSGQGGSEINTLSVSLWLHIFNATFYTVISEKRSYLREQRGREPSFTMQSLLTAVFITWSSSPSYLSVGHLITSR